MNRKNLDKQSNNEEYPVQQQIIIPKFSPNWASIIRLDRIIINISDCQYQVVPKVAKELKWKVKNDVNNPEWDVWWTDWAVQAETLMKMEHHQKINHFPGMYTLSRKNLMAKNLMKMRKKNPEQYNFFPLTWNLPGDYLDLKSYFQTKPKGKARTYIVKPQCLSQGKGIFLTRKLEDINPQQHCVVQRYLSKPFLIDGLKFDLRIYILVASVDPLRVFIFRQGLGRFATELYVGPNKDNMEDICMHLTNYAINKQSQKFVFNLDDKDMGIGHKRSLQAVFKVMQDQGINVVELKEKIHDVIIKTLISGSSHLKFQYRSSQPQNYRSDMCYQILGFDIIINEDLQPLVLQINYTPSFSTDTPLDLAIKKSLIHDALVLMGVNKQFKQQTVKQRKDYRDLRMMTGKKVKLSYQQKQMKRKEAMQIRDQYMDQHLGGFTKIFPLREDNPRQAVYDSLIKLQAQISGNFIDVKRQKPSTQQTIIRRNTQKINKLPAIVVVKDQIENEVSKKINSAKKSDYSKGSLKQIREDERQKLIQQFKMQRQNDDHQMSLKMIQKLKLRQISINRKKPVQVRQTLVPKTIQFEGNRLDGLGQYYKNNVQHPQ